MLENIKNKALAILGGLVAILAFLFMIEKNKRKSAEAVADNKEMLDKLNEIDVKKAKTDGQIESEEAKREEIKKETDEKKNSTDGNDDFFNGRK